MKAATVFHILGVAWAVVAIAVTMWSLSLIYNRGVEHGRAECFKEQVELLHKANDMEIERLLTPERPAVAGTVEL